MIQKSTSVKNVKKSLKRALKRGRPPKRLITVMESGPYAQMLMENSDKIKACIPYLTKKQESMMAAMLYLTMNPDTTSPELEKRYNLSQRTIFRLADLIKKVKLPYRTNHSMICKMVELEWFGKDTPAGKMTYHALQKRNTRRKKK